MGVLDQRLKPILVGQAPSRTSDPARPWSGRSGKVLAELAGMGHDEFLSLVEPVNLLRRWPGSAGDKGDRFPMAEARRAAESIDLRGRLAVLAGKQVAAAFRIRQPEWFFWVPIGNGLAATVPHPSGVNTWYNDPENRARLGAFLRFLLLARSRGGSECAA